MVGFVFCFFIYNFSFDSGQVVHVTGKLFVKSLFYIRQEAYGKKSYDVQYYR